MGYGPCEPAGRYGTSGAFGIYRSEVYLRRPFDVSCCMDRRQGEKKKPHRPMRLRQKSNSQGALVCAAALITLILCQQYGLMFQQLERLVL